MSYELRVKNYFELRTMSSESSSGASGASAPPPPPWESPPALQLSRCEVSLIVMFSKRWAPSGGPTSDVAMERDLPRADPSRYHGCQRGALTGQLCVYADPLYRAPRGTPMTHAPLTESSCPRAPTKPRW